MLYLKLPPYRNAGCVCLLAMEFHVQMVTSTTAISTGLLSGPKVFVMAETIAAGRVHTSTLTDPYWGCAKDFIVIA